ncbi:MAG: hypothetical protein ACOY3Z_05125 [Thermodesulfobacteriota bacterium]
MTFSCKNYDYNDDKCLKLKVPCIPGRPGCVLEGKVKLSEDLQARIDQLADSPPRRRTRDEKR